MYQSICASWGGATSRARSTTPSGRFLESDHAVIYTPARYFSGCRPLRSSRLSSESSPMRLLSSRAVRWKWCVSRGGAGKSNHTVTHGLGGVQTLAYELDEQAIGVVAGL